MAVRTITLDDLDGKSEGATTFYFSVGDDFYEIDLVTTNIEAFKKAVAKFVDKARPAKPRKASSNGASGLDTQAIREWAAQNKVEVSAKGRISQDVVDKYQAAQPAA